MMTDFEIPEVIFGTSGLGNLYKALPEDVKMDIIGECVRQSIKTPFFDTAGKYGAGLALESLGKGLRKAGVNAEEVVISNKLGWLRTDLENMSRHLNPECGKIYGTTPSSK